MREWRGRHQSCPIRVLSDAARAASEIIYTPMLFTFHIRLPGSVIYETRSGRQHCCRPEYAAEPQLVSRIRP